MQGPVEQLVPPVVMISACGLLCMAQFGRYSGVIGRIRGFHQERLKYLAQLPSLTGHELALTRRRSEELELQAHRVLELANMIRKALLFLVGAVMLLIVSSLLIGAELVWPNIGAGPSIAALVAGMTSMLIGMTYVFREVLVSLEVVNDEHERLESLIEPDPEHASS